MALSATTSQIDGVTVVYLSGAILFWRRVKVSANFGEGVAERIQPNRSRFRACHLY